jgi:cysteinyl-tRNA synthetase
MNLHIHNTLTNKKELFLPCSSAESINMYVCGPTVYSEPHIGNARAALTGDLFYRVLKELFDNVVYMRNLTDVDDKIIDQSSKTGIPISKLTEDVARIYQKNMLELNMLKPTHEPKVTDNINNIISTIEKILINKSAYISEKHVVFDTVAFENYGTLSKKIANDLIDGARIKPEAFKRNQKDFVLWKPSQNDKHGWDSPWGYGRPGWHIECTSMIKSIIGNNNTLDIHGGGNDLIFPHHENEIAQGSCCSSSKYCNYWFHNGIVLVNKKKMSKSLGNVILVSDIINRYDPSIIRLALMSTHYRQPLNWTDDTINNAKNIYEKIVRTLDNASQLDVTRDDNFLELLCDDINTPNAIQYLIKQAKLARHDIKVMSKFKYNCQLVGIVSNRKSIEINPNEKQMIENLIEKREMARKNRDFLQADSIRDQLTALSVVLEDGPSGVTWKIKR